MKLNLKKLGAIAIIGYSLIFNPIKTTKDYWSFRRNIDQHVIEAISLQEKELGIKHQGRPNVKFRRPPFEGVYLAEANYIPWTDTIHFDSFLPTLFISTATFGLCNINYRGVLHHELGHFYCDKIRERNNIAFSNNQFTRTIEEGIAEYFRRSIRSEKAGHGSYNRWYNKVKPVIEKEGVEVIESLVISPDKFINAQHL